MPQNLIKSLTELLELCETIFLCQHNFAYKTTEYTEFATTLSELRKSLRLWVNDIFSRISNQDMEFTKKQHQEFYLTISKSLNKTYDLLENYSGIIPFLNDKLGIVQNSQNYLKVYIEEPEKFISEIRNNKSPKTEILNHFGCMITEVPIWIK